MRDFQKSKVYAWENSFVKPKDKSSVPFDNIQTIVSYVWKNEGLKYPPKVKTFKKKTAIGDATRLAIRFKKNDSIPTWIILHEIAHSLTSDFEGNSNHHGADYLGIYIQLLAKYLHIPLCDLTYSARQAGLEFNLKAVALETYEIFNN